MPVSIPKWVKSCQKSRAALLTYTYTYTYNLYLSPIAHLLMQLMDTRVFRCASCCGL